MVSGVDSASNLSNVASELVEKGYFFACRYYSSRSASWKIMSTSESAALSAAGIKRVVVFEYSNKASYFTETQGRTDASEAISLGRARGQAIGSVIYYAVDFDASEAQINGGIKDYFTAVKSDMDLAGYSVGVYGSGRTCRMLKEAGLVQYTWLAMSTGWAEYSTYTDWNIKQQRTITISGVSVDTDIANDLSSIGGW